MPIHSSEIYSGDNLDPMMNQVVLSTSDCTEISANVYKSLTELSSQEPIVVEGKYKGRFSKKTTNSMSDMIIENFNSAPEREPAYMTLSIMPLGHHFVIDSAYHEEKRYYRVVHVFGGYGTAGDWLDSQNESPLNTSNTGGMAAYKNNTSEGLELLNKQFVESRKKYGGNIFFTEEEFKSGFLKQIDNAIQSNDFNSFSQNMSDAFGIYIPKEQCATADAESLYKSSGASIMVRSCSSYKTEPNKTLELDKSPTKFLTWQEKGDKIDPVSGKNPFPKRG